MTLTDAISHLSPELWARANRALVRKALAEFSHERLLTPKPLGGDVYSVLSDDGTVEYRFSSALHALDHWSVDERSITRHVDGEQVGLDALDFHIEFQQTLGLSPEVLPVYLEEISSTLAGTGFKYTKPQTPSSTLSKSSFQDIETGMTEGHPCFVANNGRLGFGVHEYLSYAPEAASPVHLVWVAAHKDVSTFTAGAGLDHDTFLREELGGAAIAGFEAKLTSLDLDPADYHFLPVHPWQWWNKTTVTFAAEIANRRLVLLGEGEDAYLPQQSIRTFFNTTTPTKHYVKTAISVLNMGFMRGLSAAYMEATPAINDWLHQLIESDPVLRSVDFSIIRERAAIGYHHRQYERATDRYSPYRKMLAALWRESPVNSLRDGERLATMASLLHVDEDGKSFVGALITESGLTPAEWLRPYLRAYLLPLLHCFYQYDLAYMPHGENTILVIKDGVVQRAIFKDIAEEIVIMDPDAVLPPAVERIKADIPEDMKLLSIFTDVFDCFFRFLNSILVSEGICDESTFWQSVADCAHDYQASLPALADRFARYDLFTPEFQLSCLNRLQLRDNQQMVDLADPSAALQLIGTLKNPVAPFAARR
ncbi:IucA/IucC family siderophore biosynthesis protein [Streptomyces sp. NBC_00091]|uniref:IucA/IucC family protein n=1 Tax=Streptomyces sp. NBC_00091 TaxID=2975648 RepID=UPI00224DC27A|nr:IucA/IucC family siderophore biosynthesis protein [Streptomyces sp. NBC_00091]MCX5378242.1 IucA/IucC family siderophore biosynthesis protein [Streptomyces sp. NBC_00091]